MKNIFVLIFSMLMVLSLAACGGQTNTPKQDSAPVEQTTPQASGEQADAPEAAVSQETAPAFDTAWAGADYVMPIPEVPFAEYDVSYSDTQKLYMIVDISASEARADHAVLSAYCDTLKNAGYTTIEKDVLSADVFQTEVSSMGASTLFAAGNPDGLRVMVYQEESTPMVWVYAPN